MYGFKNLDTFEIYFEVRVLMSQVKKNSEIVSDKNPITYSNLLA